MGYSVFIGIMSPWIKGYLWSVNLLSYFKYELPSIENKEGNAITRFRYYFSRENSYLLVLSWNQFLSWVLIKGVTYNMMGSVLFNISKMLLKSEFYEPSSLKVSLFTLNHECIFTRDQMIIIVSNITIIMKSATI